MRRKSLSVDEAQSSEKEQISMQLTKKFLFEIDEFSKQHLGGISRAAVFVNAFRIMRLYYEEKLGIRPVDTDQVRLNKIESSLEKLANEEARLRASIEKEMQNAPDPQALPTYQNFRIRIIEIITKSKTLTTPAIAQLLGCEEAVAFIMCSQLKKESILTMNEKFEWMLNDTLPE